MTKKLFSILLALAMLLCMLPAAFAEDIELVEAIEETDFDWLYEDEANADSSVTYRALLVGEVNFSWETANRNYGDTQLFSILLNNVVGPYGNRYNITCKYNLSNTGIKNAISSTFSGADSNDVSLFFIATHGVTNIASGAYAGELVTISNPGVSDDYLKLGDLASWLKAVPGKVIVVLGSCGSGAAVYNNGTLCYEPNDTDEADEAFSEAVIQAFQDADEAYMNESGAVSNTGEFRNSKFYVLTAAAHQESSWGQEGSIPYNYFPYWFVVGGYVFNGMPADSNGDKFITLNEMYQYVYNKALGPYYSGGTNYYQHAKVYPENSSYQLFKDLPFDDVKSSKYYYEPVLWAFYNDPQITGGTDFTHFNPNGVCTREQIVTFLWKACGAPEPSSTSNPFTDVKSGKYYYKAVLWAVQNGITSGVSSNKFGVGESCTREQAMTFLWKAAGSPSPSSSSNPFKDVKSGKYYYNAVLWAVQNGITSGVESNRFGVGQTCTRGQIVTFLYKTYGED